MPQPKVSILMLTCNRPERIGKAIQSIYSQTFQDWELIIVQDGGNPETQQLLQSWLAKDPRIRYFPRGILGSIAEASNYGLERATGDYVAILDDDDEWCVADKLAKQVDFLDRNLDYAGCGGGYIVIDVEGKVRGRYLKPESDEAIRARALVANPMANSTAIFRRVLKGKPVFYDAAMRQFADWDFWLAVGSLGKLHNSPAHLAYYCLWEGGSSFRNLRGNAQAAIAIVRKHRHAYRGYTAAMAMAYLYYSYTCLPASVRNWTYVSLSALKKALTGARAGSA